MLTIPTTSSQADYVQRTTLDGTAYVIRLRWSERAGAWSFSLSDADGAPIVEGLRLAANWPLLRRVADGRRPPGEIIAHAPTGGDPGRYDLGARVQLVYIERSDIEGALG